MVRQALRVGSVAVVLAVVWPSARAWAPQAPDDAVLHADAARVEPTATAHPPVPRDLASLWLVPDGRPVPPLLLKNFTKAVELVEAESFDEARPALTAPALARTPVADYARYYVALIDLRKGEAVRARESFHTLVASKPAGILAEWALAGEARAAEQSGDQPGAAALFEQLSKAKPEEPDTVLLGLGRTLAASGNRDKALQVYRELYYGYPMSDVATEARTQMGLIGGQAAVDEVRELARAELLFTNRRYNEALTAFDGLSPKSGDDRELVAMRIAECQYYQGKHRQALTAIQPYVNDSKREAEARFFALSAMRGVGDHAGYVAAAEKLVTDFGSTSWAEETLNNLATHYILIDDDPTAGTVFARYLERFPQGKYGARAAWKLGWWRYRGGDYASAAALFDRAAATYPRSDYRPSWIYWAGRAYDKLKDTEHAVARFELVRTDYLHSYYGRLATEYLSNASGKRSPIGAMASSAPVADVVPLGLPPNATDIRQLILSGAYALAEAEVKYAQRKWGQSPSLEATRAWLLRERGEYRQAINAMRRAYPQYMTREGELLPLEARRVIFPLDFWSLIERHSADRGLDPYLIAALVAQESSFDPGVRSAANAYGLMQIVPSTGRRLAKSLGLRKFTTGKLTDPETNVKLGTFYFKGLVNQFGGAHFALASYNAGENRVGKWIAERGPLPQDEFIDDIPFPETQIYVKKILGTAEDYRQLYGDRKGNAN